MSAETEINLIAELIRVQRGVIEIAVTDSPEAAVDMIGEYFEDAGVDDEATRKLLNLWWASRPHYSRVHECELREQE